MSFNKYVLSIMLLANSFSYTSSYLAHNGVLYGSNTRSTLRPVLEQIEKRQKFDQIVQRCAIAVVAVVAVLMVTEKIRRRINQNK